MEPVKKVQCKFCEKKGIYRNQGVIYCKEHFLDYFEKKVFKTIMKYDMISRGDNVCVATSGGKDSLSVLYLIMKYCKKKKIDFFALVIDEGIAGYRDHTVRDLKKFCDKYGIRLEVASFKKSFGKTLDEVKEKAIDEHNKKPCTVCGVFRRSLLNTESRRLGATKLATGHNLDDEAQTFLMNLFQGNMAHNAKMGPISGIHTDKKFIPRIKPLYFITEQETRLYCLLKGFEVEFNECPNIGLSFRVYVRDMLNEVTAKLPNAKYGVVNAFLEVLPDLKEKYKRSVELNPCVICGEPTTQEKCNACILEDKLCSELKNT